MRQVVLPFLSVVAILLFAALPRSGAAQTAATRKANADKPVLTTG